MESLGVYISVPFCKAKCTFCNFASGAFGLERMDGYVDSLVNEIEAVRGRAAELEAGLPGVVDSVYFGGGTPSLLEAEQLRRIFAALRGQFEVAHDAETTLECAPGQMADTTLEAALQLGVNRVSFGVQSFVDAESAAVGRLHTAEQCVAEIARVRAAGIEEVSLDLIAGLPRQTAKSWERSLDAVIQAGVPHASVYMLEVDEESRLGKELIAGGPRYQASAVPSDEAMTEFYMRACERFEVAGLKQYEISNFAREGHASQHNLKYWSLAPYVGFGVDAHSMLTCREGAVRFANADSLEAYAAGGAREVTVIDADAAFEEALFLGLRRNVGVDLRELQREFGMGRVNGFAGAALELVDGGVMRREGERVMLTDRGRMISNEVFGELLRGGGLTDVELVSALPEHEPILANLLELYAHDFSEFAPLLIGDSGRFGYPHLSLYWSDCDRFPFLLRKDDGWAGLVFVKRGSVISNNPAVWDMAEFFVLRGHRRLGVGADAAAQVWKTFPGPWEVRAMDRNVSALKFWSESICRFTGEIVDPVLCSVAGKNWNVFSFESKVQEKQL